MIRQTILAVLAASLTASLPIAANPGPQFTHPLEINNPYLPLANLKKDVLEGTEKGKKLRAERTRMPSRKSFSVNGQTVEAMIVEDREFMDGKLSEVTLDYFAQDDDGNVYYMGEDVNNYKDGTVIGHGGSWHYGKDGAKLGLLMPAHLVVGQKFRSEAISAKSREADEIISLTNTAKVPAGTFTNCVAVKDTASDGEVEQKIYAPGVGAIREEEAVLISHN